VLCEKEDDKGGFPGQGSSGLRKNVEEKRKLLRINQKVVTKEKKMRNYGGLFKFRIPEHW